MKSPGKLFIVISRKNKRDLSPATDLFLKRKRAKEVAKNRNKIKSGLVDDWRVVPYEKDSSPRK